MSYFHPYPILQSHQRCVQVEVLSKVYHRIIQNILKSVVAIGIWVEMKDVFETFGHTAW